MRFKLYPFVLVLAVAPALTYADSVSTDRYTRVSLEPRPEQISPMLAVVNIQFSENVKTVGDAIFELLAGSGYRWDVGAEENHRLMELPLPIVSRSLGPVRLKDALTTLAGQSWTLTVDEFSRVISFEVRGR